MSADGIKIRGDITIRMIEVATGRVVQQIDVRNAIMNAGFEAIGNLLTQSGSDPASKWRVAGLMAGTGTTAAVNTQTGLAGSEKWYVSIPAYGREVDAGPPVVLKFSATLDSLPEGKVLTEAGLFLNDGAGTAANPGKMFARQVHAAITTAPGVVPDYFWRITLTA